MTMLKHPVLIIILKEIKTRLDQHNFFFEQPTPKAIFNKKIKNTQTSTKG